MWFDDGHQAFIVYKKDLPKHHSSYRGSYRPVANSSNWPTAVWIQRKYQSDKRNIAINAYFLYKSDIIKIEQFVKTKYTYNLTTPAVQKQLEIQSQIKTLNQHLKWLVIKHQLTQIQFVKDKVTKKFILNLVSFEGLLFLLNTIINFTKLLEKPSLLKQVSLSYSFLWLKNKTDFSLFSRLKRKKLDQKLKSHSNITRKDHDFRIKNFKTLRELLIHNIGYFKNPNQQYKYLILNHHFLLEDNLFLSVTNFSDNQDSKTMFYRFSLLILKNDMITFLRSLLS